MSQWMRLKTQIKNLDSLKKACEENEIEYEDLKYSQTNVAKLNDLHKGGPTYSRFAHICKQDGYYTIEGDTDPNYSSLAARLGADYGKLLQDYAKHEVLNNVQSMGGVLTEQKLKEDGSLVLRISL